MDKCIDDYGVIGDLRMAARAASDGANEWSRPAPCVSPHPRLVNLDRAEGNLDRVFKPAATAAQA